MVDCCMSGANGARDTQECVRGGPHGHVGFLVMLHIEERKR